LKHDIELTQLEFNRLLYKDTKIEKFQPKWYRNLSEGKIEIINQIYTLSLNENKRKLVFNKNSKLIGTKPYKIDQNKSLSK
jgi:hypothetical protein